MRSCQKNTLQCQAALHQRKIALTLKMHKCNTLSKGDFMTTKCPRLYVTLDPIDHDIIHILAKQKDMSVSSVMKKIVQEWLEEYEDILWARKAEESEKECEGKKTISHEDLCKKLGI